MFLGIHAPHQDWKLVFMLQPPQESRQPFGACMSGAKATVLPVTYSHPQLESTGELLDESLRLQLHPPLRPPSPHRQVSGERQSSRDAPSASEPRSETPSPSRRGQSPQTPAQAPEQPRRLSAPHLLTLLPTPRAPAGGDSPRRGLGFSDGRNNCSEKTVPMENLRSLKVEGRGRKMRRKYKETLGEREQESMSSPSCLLPARSPAAALPRSRP